MYGKPHKKALRALYRGDTTLLCTNTPKELGMDDRFEDCPKAINEIQYGRVFRKATTVQKGGVSSIYDNMD